MTKKRSITFNELKSSNEKVHLMSLGGLGEIGMNCLLAECNGEMIFIDCGQMMPDEEMLGVDAVIPDITFLNGITERVKGILLTHAHEDHIGALPYLLPKFPNIPIYGTELTIEIVREKLREHKLNPNFIVIYPRETFKVGNCFEVEPISVTHSMIDTVGFAVKTPVGVFIHSGDFKIDPHPPDGVAFDHFAFASYAESEQGVLLLMSDSTNVGRSGSCPSEMEVVPGIDRLMREAEGAIILSTFASSLHRIQNVMNIAAKNKKIVVSVGLNMERNIRIASRLGAITIPGEYYSHPKEIAGLRREDLVILCTGSQGEPMSSLSRMANGTHRDCKVQEGDTVILSSRMIPGNERPIYRMLNQLTRLGAKVITEKSAPIHVSGHGYRDDMKTMINLTNPKYFTPLHGEYRHLRDHCKLAQEQGLSKDETILLENGDCLELRSDSAKIIGQIPHGRVLVDGKGIGDVDEAVIRDRHYLSQDGMVVVVIGIDHETGELLSGPELLVRGFAAGEGSDEELKSVVLKTFEGMDVNDRIDQHTAQSTIKRALRNHIRIKNQQFPVIMIVVLEL
ncbi:MAG: ribonuclease J [Sumerlaeia bacterium]